MRPACRSRGRAISRSWTRRYTRRGLMTSTRSAKSIFRRWSASSAVSCSLVIFSSASRSPRWVKTPGATTMTPAKVRSRVAASNLFHEPGRTADADNLRPVGHGSVLRVEQQPLAGRMRSSAHRRDCAPVAAGPDTSGRQKERSLPTARLLRKGASCSLRAAAAGAGPRWGNPLLGGRCWRSQQSFAPVGKTCSQSPTRRSPISISGQCLPARWGPTP